MMTTTAGRQTYMVKPVNAISALLIGPVVLLGGCSSNESSKEETSSAPPAAQPSTEKMTTQLKTVDGTAVANATIEFANGYATVTVETVASKVLNPGFHALHIHAVLVLGET